MTRSSAHITGDMCEALFVVKTASFCFGFASVSFLPFLVAVVDLMLSKSSIVANR